MRLPFLDREEESARLRRLLGRPDGALGVLYGRRRCGKSRLLRETLPAGRSVYYVGDDRESTLQRSGLATEIASLLPGFDRVRYPDWEALLRRWWDEASAGSALVLDEFPAVVGAARELPSVLQKLLDRFPERRLHLLLAGSSQRMMQGLALDRTAPLYGRAAEVLRISPLGAGWILQALKLRDAVKAVEAFAVWGGIPRYWELAADHDDLATAARELVLSPLGVLHEEPGRLLLDDVRDTAQAASILSLIGQGCHRSSEIAARLGKPATSLSRPLQRLLEMGLIERETPFGAPRRGGKRALYRIADPFLGFWFGFVDPNRSRLEARQIAAVEAEVHRKLPHHFGQIWEKLVRMSVPLMKIQGESWGPAKRWWGTGLDRKPAEIDLVAESLEGDRLLLGEVKWTAPKDASRILDRLREKARKLPFVRGREVVLGIWIKGQARGRARERAVSPRRVLEALR